MKEETIIKEIVKKIEELNLVQISELTKVLQEKYNISNEIIISEPKKEQKEEKKELINVIIKLIGLKEDFKEGPKKIQAYKFVSIIANSNGRELNVIQAKKLVDEGVTLLENIISDKAQEIKKQLEENGVEVTII